MSCFSSRVDACIGAPAASDYDRALLRERFTALKQQLPWLHGILIASLSGIVLALGKYPDAPRAPAVALIGIIFGRAVFLKRTQPRQLSDEAIAREIRKTFFTALLFFSISLAWQLGIYFSLSAADAADIAVFSGLIAIGASSGLSSFPAAARLPVLICSVPFAVLLALSPKPVQQAIGLALIVVVIIRLRLIQLQDKAFERLVRAKVAVQEESRKALQSEQEALFERARVEVIANTDTLTGLDNRRGFLSLVSGFPSNERRQLALMIFDLDGFKAINDTFGHFTGDRVLQEVGARLQRVSGDCLAAARLGGDEFALLARCSASSEAVQVARMAVSVLSEPYVIDGRSMRISACAGVSYQHGDSVPDAMRRADMALYHAKRSTRGSVSLFTPEMDEQIQRRTTIEQALRDPDLPAELELLFQPILHIGSMKLSSFEALTRWHHPELGWISPSEFIPITEQISVLNEISDALLVRAAAIAREWPSSVRLSFNLSPVQLCSPATATRLLEIVEQQQLPFDRVQFEVTETALLADFAVARENLSTLRAHGIQILLDDFGAGYSSIGYLREIRFDLVKLDGALIASSTDGAGRALLRGVLDLCRATGHECVAEHVETPEQLHLLRQLGCSYGQGFGLCRPVPAPETAAIAASAAVGAGDDELQQPWTPAGFPRYGRSRDKVDRQRVRR
jgi:diguanylate cyclase (GGDEF)-like protein